MQQNFLSLTLLALLLIADTGQAAELQLPVRVFVGDIGLGVSRGIIKSLSRNSKALVKRRKMPNDASITAEKDELMLLERNCKNIYFLYAGNRFQASPLQLVGEGFVLFLKQRLKKKKKKRLSGIWKRGRKPSSANMLGNDKTQGESSRDGAGGFVLQVQQHLRSCSSPAGA